MNRKIKDVYLALKEAGLDALILSSPANISYLTDSASRDSYLLVSAKENIYLTDSRYLEEAKIRLKGDCAIREINGSFFEVIADTCKDYGFRRIGCEERYLTIAEFKKIKEKLGKGRSLLPTHNIVEALRVIKSREELEKIRKAVQITKKALDFIRGFLAPGKTELEISGEIERFIRQEGARACAFETIVASGPNSCFVHHMSSQRKLKSNELVLVDIGVDYLGLKSDLTRVFFLGKINSLAKKIYAIVKEAQAKAIKEIRPASRIKDIDAAARQYISKNGYGAFFSHSLGHGVGLEIHEAPQISAKENNLVEKGMVFTVEPGIYLPGKFGIRIEDMVSVTAKGIDIL